MKIVRYIAVSVMFALALSCSGPKVIPEKTMSKIYADMFLADQWMASNVRARKDAENSLFYEPVFKKYGYTTADYDASVRYYVERPDDYAKILKTAALQLDNEAKRLQKVEDSYARQERISPYIPREFSLETTMPEDTMMNWHPADTVLLRVQSDTTGVVDSLQIVEPVTDTILTIIDTLSDYEQKRDSKEMLRVYGSDDTTSGRYIRVRERPRGKGNPLP